MRVTGSLAFVAAARAAYLVAQDPQNPARRFFLPMKNNLGPDSLGLAFHIDGTTLPGAAGPLQTSLVVRDSEPVSDLTEERMRKDVRQRKADGASGRTINVEQGELSRAIAPHMARTLAAR